MKQKLFALVLALTLVLSLAACGGKDAPEVNTPEGGEAGPTASDSAPGENRPGEPGAPAENEPQTDVDLAGFYASLTEGEEWPVLMDLMEDESMAELLDSYYPGLSEISTRQRGVYVAAISASVGEIALVEVENAGDVQAVRDIFQTRIDNQVGDEENPGGAWYPETIEGWKNKSRIVSHGNYVMLAVGDAAEKAVESFEALFE